MKVLVYTDGTVHEMQRGDESVFATSIADGYAKVLTGKAAIEAVRNCCREELLTLIKPRDNIKLVYCGDNRWQVYVIDGRNHKPDNLYIRNITTEVARLVGFRLTKYDDILLTQAPTSTSFWIAYSLGQALWPNGTDKPHGVRNGEPDTSGGYAIGYY